jgi:hypothetical protein
MKDRSLASRKALYRSREIIPVPLKMAGVSWREHSLLSEAYETPRGGWDVVLEKGEGTITREVHWPRPKVTLRTQARLLSGVEMEATLSRVRGEVFFASYSTQILRVMDDQLLRLSHRRAQP